MLDVVTDEFDNEDASFGTEQLYKVLIKAVPTKLNEDLYRVSFKFFIEGEEVGEKYLENETEVRVIAEEVKTEEPKKALE